MKAILVEHKVAIPKEFQLKVKAMMALLKQVTNKYEETTGSGYAIHTAALKRLKTDLYEGITSATGELYLDYPIWGVSDSNDELIGYRYEFQEEK